jgi:hypothetical protein
VTPTLSRLFDITPPRACAARSLDLSPVDRSLPPIERALVFAADALGARLVEDFPEAFAPVLAHAPIQVRARAVLPSVTPVCFASMFTGAPPETHGIRKYEKPILACDTLFDALTRSGRTVAIVAVQDSSIDRIFRNRPIDYFTERYDPEVLDRARSLVRGDRHDLILVYQQEYDDRMHASVPRSPEALAAMENHVKSFDALAAVAGERWSDRPHALCFLTDHGTHIDPDTGRGTHGSDLPDDMDVVLFWGLREGSGAPPAPMKRGGAR